MIFRQLFDQVSGTYSYLLASRRGGEALIIDPVLEKVDRYLQLIKELDLKPRKALPAVYAAVEGRHAGLPLFDSLVLLGRERALARIRAARSRLP